MPTMTAVVTTMAPSMIRIIKISDRPDDELVVGILLRSDVGILVGSCVCVHSVDVFNDAPQQAACVL